MNDVADPLSSQAIEEIERIDPPTTEEFARRYARRGRAVVLRASSPASGGWSLARLDTELGDLEVSAIRTKRGRLEGTAKSGTGFRRVRLGEILSAIADGRDCPWHVSTPVSELPARFAAEVPAPAYVAGAAFVRSRLWLAPAGTVTPLHWDLPANFIWPLFGRRRVLLYPRAQGLLVYPNRPHSRMPNFAAFDPEKPDARRMPLARLARPVRTILAPGDMLFIPPGWWHHIRSLETSLVVNCWWGGRALELAWRGAQLYKSLRGLYRGEWS